MVRLVANYHPQHKVSDAQVLAALRRVPRHEFVPLAVKPLAYDDMPLPIGEGQTISQPFMVGYMTQWLELKPSDRVLEVGTGSGYHAAVLSHLASEVYTVEIVPSLGNKAKRLLDRLGYRNVFVRIGDGYQGWPDKAPFDAIVVTCAPEHVPEPLVRQLKRGGRMMIPVGAPVGSGAPQQLYLVRKTDEGLKTERKLDVRFVEMTGEAKIRVKLEGR
ncbi:MAG: protein-L-isoaspartate(D-aspartate) O-methyltransferase [Elusimicrobia bacterium]|nr:protein-L-isoaspartate(D-aspartate) O-methyltransferase [Elusimicrobiota bacterium]